MEARAPTPDAHSATDLAWAMPAEARTARGSLAASLPHSGTGHQGARTRVFDGNG